MNKEESKVVNDVQQVPTKEITREFVKIPKICIECQISTDFNFACHECRFVKCKRCAMQDIRITRVKLPVYFCKICFNKEKKKTMNETNYLNLFRRKRKRGNLTSKSKGEIKQTPEILDMDKLHNIDKPSKKVLFTRKINSMSRSNTSQIELRKSERTRNKLTEMELNAINCHECKTIKLTSHIQTCSNVECCESYCMGCIAKYPSRNATREDIKNWICFKCKRKCRCKMCNFLSSDFIANTRKYKRKKIKSRLSHVKRTKNIISIPIVNLPEKNVVKVDDFIIYEEIDNISDPNENLKGILNDSNKYRSPSPSGSRRSHNSFDELDYKIMNDKSISNKLINAYAHVENFYTNKYGSTMLKKACRGCNITNFHSNDLLRFKNFSELLHYLKYSFVFKRELLKCEKEMFDHNKRHLFDFYENFFSKKEEIYKNPATICKFCFMQILNRPNYMEEIKRIFIETQNKQPVSVNVAVEGKDMNITIINNYNEVKHTNSSKVSSFDNNISQTFNDKPSNTSKPFTENPFFVINNKIIVTLDELSKQVFNLNYRTREIGCSAIDQQAYRTINAKVDELRSLVSSIFPFIAEHKEYLNKLMETFCQIYENKEFEVDERLRKEINNIHLKLIQLVEENNSYCGKYMEFIRTLASLCYNLLLQLNNQFSTLGLIQAINRNCRNFNLC